MNEEIFFVKNVKCGGCTSAIEKGLSELDGIASVTAEIEAGKVTVTGNLINREAIAEALQQLGYPEA